MHMKRPIRHTSLVLALLSFTAACHSASPSTDAVEAAAPNDVPQPAVATPAQKAAAPLEYAQIRQLEALGSRCAWLGAAELAAVKASAEERHAWLVWQGLDIVAATDQADALVEQSGDIDCESAKGEEYRTGVGYGAWQMRSSWALRGHAMLPGPDSPAWFAGKSSVIDQRAALDEAVAGLKAINAASVELSQEMFRDDATRMLATRCPASGSDCPASESANDVGWNTYAEKVLQQTEAYAELLNGIEDKVGRPPEPEES